MGSPENNRYDTPEFRRAALVGTGLVFVAGLFLCAPRQDNDPPPLPDDPKPSEIDKVVSGSRNGLKAPIPPNAKGGENRSVNLPTNEDGLIDTTDSSLLVPLENCIESETEAMCDNPWDPLSSRCITFQEGGGIRVIFEDPHSGDIDINYMDEDRIHDDWQLKMIVGGSDFFFTMNLSDPVTTGQQLGLACDQAARWLNTRWGDLDRAVVCKGVEPDSDDCDDFIDLMKEKGSGGYEVSQKVVAVQRLLDDAGIEYMEDAPYMMSMDLIGKDGDPVGIMSIKVETRDGTVGYFIHSTLARSDFQLIENPEEAMARITRNIKMAGEYQPQ